MLSKNWKNFSKAVQCYHTQKNIVFEEKNQFFTDNLERENFLEKKLINYL